VAEQCTIAIRASQNYVVIEGSVVITAFVAALLK